MKLSRIVIKGTLLTFLGSSCFIAAVGSAQVSSFSDCGTIENRDERYRCYDAIEANQAAPVVEDVEESATGAARNSQQEQSVPRGNTQNLPVVRLPRQVERQEEQPVAESNVRDREETTNEQIDDFGLEKETADTRIREGADGQTELVDTITEISRIGQGLSVFTLSSGQRWQQTETKRYYLREGEEVRIYPSKWGTSYRLTSSRLRGFIQVKRID